MNKNGERVMLGIVVLFLIIIFILLSNFVGYDRGYKNGQIDAINGVIKYQIVTNKVSWEKISN